MRTDLVEGLAPGHLKFPDPKRDHIQGSPDAPVALMEYGDFQCPYCGDAYGVVKRVQDLLGDKLCFAFRNFPLTNIHRHAEHAAEAAEAAGAQGKYWEMHDALFENQQALEDEDIAGYASGLGLDGHAVMDEVRSGTYAGRVREDFLSGVRSDVTGTPTFFINGERYDGEVEVRALVVAISEAMKD